MKLLDFLEKIYKIAKKYGLKVTLPLFLNQSPTGQSPGVWRKPGPD